MTIRPPSRLRQGDLGGTPAQTHPYRAVYRGRIRTKRIFQHKEFFELTEGAYVRRCLRLAEGVGAVLRRDVTPAAGVSSGTKLVQARLCVRTTTPINKLKYQYRLFCAAAGAKREIWRPPCRSLSQAQRRLHSNCMNRACGDQMVSVLLA